MTKVINFMAIVCVDNSIPKVTSNIMILSIKFGKLQSISKRNTIRLLHYKYHIRYIISPRFNIGPRDEGLISTEGAQYI